MLIKIRRSLKNILIIVLKRKGEIDTMKLIILLETPNGKTNVIFQKDEVREILVQNTVGYDMKG